MNILREALNDPVKIEFLENTIRINDNEYIRKLEVEFTNLKTKKYNLEQIVFFLINKNLEYTKYLKMCKKENIGQVFYIDQKIILEEIEKKDSEIPLFVCDNPETKYLSKHDYYWVKDLFNKINNEKIKPSEKRDTYKIIVPSSVTSYINLNNIETFLKCGQITKKNEFLLDQVEFEVKNKKFIAEDSVVHWTSDDWDMLVAVFCDGSKWQLDEWRIGDIASLFDRIPAFYVQPKGKKNNKYGLGYSVQSIFVDKNVCDKETFELLWRKINLSARRLSSNKK